LTHTTSTIESGMNYAPNFGPQWTETSGCSCGPTGPPNRPQRSDEDDERRSHPPTEQPQRIMWRRIIPFRPPRSRSCDSMMNTGMRNRARNLLRRSHDPDARPTRLHSVRLRIYATYIYAISRPRLRPIFVAAGKPDPPVILALRDQLQQRYAIRVNFSRSAS
jgi:hypothetical protein